MYEFSVEDKKIISHKDFISVLLGCLSLASLGRREIPYEKFSDLKLIGRGGQGQVYKGVIGERSFALKKLRTRKETEKYHLLHLNHPNLIKFLLVAYTDLIS